MKILRKKTVLIPVCWFMILSLIFPPSVFADGGPNSPSFSKFESVSTGQMVDPYSGGFTYNLPVLVIPGPQGSGYSLSLSYHSNVTPEEEASWVGYGWTLNPGSITRNTRGLPDDYKGAEITYYNKRPENRTVSLGLNTGVEAASANLSFQTGYSKFYNNYNGWNEVFTSGISYDGWASLSFNLQNGSEVTWSPYVNPAALLSGAIKSNKGQVENTDGGTEKNEQAENWNSYITKKSISRMGYGFENFAFSARPYTIYPYEGKTFKFKISGQYNPFCVPVGFEGGISGYYTWQASDSKYKKNAYGYMYSADNDIGDEDILDYTVERQDPYTKQDLYLPIPYSNPDNFILSGEGIGGSFRLYQNRAGHFRPNKIVNKTSASGVGAEVAGGMSVELGADYNYSVHSLKVCEWIKDSDKGEYEFTEDDDESVYFRFSNDLGGFNSFGDDTKAEKAKIIRDTDYKLPGTYQYNPEIPESIQSKATNELERTGRSSYIAYHTNKEMNHASDVYAYTRDTAALNRVVSYNTLEDGIGEFAIFNNEGMQYTYGLPVYCRNEKDLRVDLYKKMDQTNSTKKIAYLDSGKGDNLNDESDWEYYMGEYRATPYAKNFLLTSITSPDYKDLTNDGPSDDDLGGYTRFTYKLRYGAEADNWFNWRIPYEGLHYDKGIISDPKDDMGSVSYGEKEVYYMDTVETKTHIAKFYTSERDDACESYGNGAASFQNACTQMDTLDNLHKLDSIILYSKQPDGNLKKLQKVNFKYDYSLMTGQPNQENSTSGKLTLKKVWVDYFDTYSAMVNLYEFSYDYKNFDDFPVHIQNKYPDIVSYSDNYTEEDQNPIYNTCLSDRWGFYQYDGESRYDNLNNWVDQSEPNTHFDPAAWHLKQIKLPSGGEILVQYEQNDYAFVQDKEAMAMVSFSSVDNTGEEPKFYIDLADLGFDPLDADTMNYFYGLLWNKFISHKEKLYFKFLYTLAGEFQSFEDCNNEYIDGYVPVKSINWDGSSMYFVLGSDDPYSTPYEICRDYARNNRRGLIPDDGSCNDNDYRFMEDVDKIFKDFIQGIADDHFDNNSCGELDLEHSYLRIPVPFAKKGGGVRVKRLLSYDKGIEGEDAMLFGKEYNYIKKNSRGQIISSGVASNEPAAGREENALIGLLDMNKQKWYEKALSGRNKKQMEGPLGEYIMPAATVGYSQLIEQNIHTGKTGTGHKKYNFYTAYDSKVVVDTTVVERKRDYMVYPLVLFNSYTDSYWLSQGYSFTLNNKAGQPKTVKTYLGDYDITDDKTPTAATFYKYHEPGETVSIFDNFSQEERLVGRNVEVVMASQAVNDESLVHEVEFDYFVNLIPPSGIPVPGACVFPTFSFDKRNLYTHTITKIVREPFLLKEVENVENNIRTLNSHLSYDLASGTPVVSQSEDSYNNLDLAESPDHSGMYINYALKASTQYPAMGQKSINERRNLISGIGVMENILMNYNETESCIEFDAGGGADICDIKGLFCEGDLVRIVRNDGLNSQKLFNLGEFYDGNKCAVFESGIYGSSPMSTNDSVTVEIIKSGKTNQLSADVGSILTYGAKAGAYNDAKPYAERHRLVDTLNQNLRFFTFSSIDLIGFGSIDVKSGVNCKKLHELYNSMRLDFFDPSGIGHGQIGTDNCLVDVYFSPDLEYDKPGEFKVDDKNGNISFHPNNNSCTPVLIDCFETCDENAVTKLGGVIAANAVTLSNSWDYEQTDYGLDGTAFNDYNDYELAKKGIWRPQHNYAYKTGIRGINDTDPNAAAYNTGIYDEFQVFDWSMEDLALMPNWKKLSETIKYDPHGNLLESKDLRGIYSSSLFGYSCQLVVAQAVNSIQQNTMFESFEMQYTEGSSTYLENRIDLSLLNGTVTDEFAHSGNYSLELDLAGYKTMKWRDVILNENTGNDGFIVRLWIKQDYSNNENLESTVHFKLNHYGLEESYSFENVVKTGEWTLLECKADSLLKIFGSGDTLVSKIDYSGSEQIWIDDVRIQPLNSSMNCYVYNSNTMQIAAQFDDQHFAVFYQYNKEGKLIRKYIETVKGKKLVEEQYQSLKKSNRPL